MKRLVALSVLISLGTGCMNLDWMYLRAEKTKRYDFSSDIVPAELIEEVSFDRGDGTMLSGVWLRQDNTTSAPPLVYFHGINNHIGTSFEQLEYYWQWGRYDVFAVDYAGFGRSEGEATFEQFADVDGVATLDYVAQTSGYATEDTVVVALSIGGFVALHAIEERPAQAAVLQSVFAHSDLLLDSSLLLDVPPGWFFEEEWDNVQTIRRVDTPVYVVHGLADHFISPESGPLLYDAAPGPKELWQPGTVNHANLWKAEPEEFEQRATEFFDRFVP